MDRVVGRGGHGGVGPAHHPLQRTWSEVLKGGRRGAPAGPSNCGIDNGDQSNEPRLTGPRARLEDDANPVADLQIGSISLASPSPPSHDSVPHVYAVPHEASFQQSPNNALVLPPRPAPGRAGRSIPVAANHFSFAWTGTSIYQYDVEITPRIWKDEVSVLKRELISRHQSDFQGKLLVFDSSKFMKIMYTAVPLSFKDKDFFVVLPNEGTRGASVTEQGAAGPKRSFKVSIRLVSVLDQSNLVEFLGGHDVPMPQHLVQALDVGFRQNPSRHLTAIGRCFYSKDLGRKELGGGLEGCNGYYQSVRPTMQGLALNVDFATITLRESIPLIEFLRKKMRNFDVNRSLSREEWLMVTEVTRGVQVQVTHRDPPRKYTISCATEAPTKDVKFPVEGGGEKRVVDYFKETYGHNIEHQGLPCVQMTSRGFVCFPMELCRICEGQKFVGELTEQQRRSFIALACLKPKQREDIIKRVMEEAKGPGSGEFLSHFGINVKKEMTKVPARILEAPKLRFGERSRVKELTPERGEWSLRDSQFVEGSQVKHWAVVSFDENLGMKNVLEFADNLSRSCRELGMELAPKTAVPPFLYGREDLERPRRLGEVLDGVKKHAEEAMGKGRSCELELLVCVVGESQPTSIGRLKRVCETKLGLITQLCVRKNVCKGGGTSTLLRNVALKLNAKMGGRNVELATPLPKLCPRVFRKKEEEEEAAAIIFGADVNHPSPKAPPTSPSFASLVANTDWPSAAKYASRSRSQPHRQEIIQHQHLHDMVLELWRAFHLSTGRRPGIILFFRDGVGEGQYLHVLRHELPALHAALALGGGPDYSPTVTYVLVEKRHHTRLFPTPDTDTDTDGDAPAPRDRRSGNILPGTVVDTCITHPREFDFFLCSHPGLQGTSKPTHYHVLLDQNRFSSDDLQRLIYHLCYTYARCTKALSLVPAAHYAHLAAKRARMYFDATEAPSLPPVHPRIENSMYYC